MTKTLLLDNMRKKGTNSGAATCGASGEGCLTCLQIKGTLGSNLD